jgi:two-component system OmpR family sensor kinase
VTRIRLRRLRPRTLRGQLTVGLVLILVMASAVLGVATAIFLRSFLINRLDQQLTQAGGRFSAGLERGLGANDADADNAVPGQSEGTVGVRLLNGSVTNAAIVTLQGKNRKLHFSAADVAALKALVPGGGPQTHDFEALGDYRLQAVTGRDGDVQIAGLPLHSVTETLARLALVEGALFVVILITGGAATTLVVRRTMRPLGRLTATAVEVSELPLTDAGTELPLTPIPTEPLSEVDQMSVAFAHMLEHVRTALVERDATERRLRRFIADASHELRTPLATIRANAEYALRADAGTATVAEAEALTRITAATERMANLVDDLLLLARLDAGRPLEREPVDLTRLVLDAVTDARTAAIDHQWRLELPEEIVTVTGDAERLHQVLANLLRNAHNHTPPGTTVTTRLVSGRDAVEVSVSDDGPGIPLDDQLELFNRFTRGDTSRSRAHGSTGLGLAIARGLADAHGGSLTLDSAPGSGACFRLRLPDGDLPRNALPPGESQS